MLNFVHKQGDINGSILRGGGEGIHIKLLVTVWKQQKLNRDYCLPVSEVYIPSCDHEGYYQKEQCMGSAPSAQTCWCVTPSGSEIPGSRVIGRAHCGMSSWAILSSSCVKRSVPSGTGNWLMSMPSMVHFNVINEYTFLWKLLCFLMD